MASVRINMRIDEGLWAFVVQEAKAREVSKTAIVERGLRHLRNDTPHEVPTKVFKVDGREISRAALGEASAGPETPRPAPPRTAGAEDGLPGPSFRLTVDQAHAWFRDPSEQVSGGYVAWRSRKDRWERNR